MRVELLDTEQHSQVDVLNTNRRRGNNRAIRRIRVPSRPAAVSLSDMTTQLLVEYMHYRPTTRGKANRRRLQQLRQLPFCVILTFCCSSDSEWGCRGESFNEFAP